MKLSQDLYHRRQVLIAQIASQRLELAQAYRQLEKPLHYGDRALQGFGFLRRNPWIAMLAPGVSGLLFSGLGALMRRGKPKQTASVDREAILKALHAEETKMKKPALKWLGYGLSAFKLYRRLRPLLP